MISASLTPRRETWLLLTLASIQFMHILDPMIMMPLGPQFRLIFSMSDAQFGLLVSACTLSAGASGSLASTCLDSFACRHLLLALCALFAAAALACGLTWGYELPVSARVAAGMFGGVLRTWSISSDGGVPWRVVTSFCVIHADTLKAIG